MDSFNILFTSSGRRVALIRHFQDALRNLGINGKIVTVDLNRHAPTGFIGDVFESVPRVTDPGYVGLLLDICRRHNIRLLIPLIDTELQLLSESKQLFEDIGVTVLVCSTETNRICRNKHNTAAFFKSISIDAPAVYQIDATLNDSRASYPFIIKPYNGSSSIGVTKIESREELKFYSSSVKEPILQEFIEGEEYTVDVLVDFEGRVRSVVPRLRLETRAGEVSKGITVKNRKIIEATKFVAEKLPGAVGCLTIQCFLTPSGQVKYIEINPRFGGGFPLSVTAGADFPRWIIEMLLGRDPKIEIDGWRDGVVMLRYDDAVFTTRDKINL